jgi:flagellar basal body-associated protein FliL
VEFSISSSCPTQPPVTRSLSIARPGNPFPIPRLERRHQQFTVAVSTAVRVARSAISYPKAEGRVMDTTSTTFPGFVTGGTGYPSSGTFGPTPTPYSSSGSFGSTFGLSSLASTLVQVLTVMTLVALVGVVIIAVVASRSEPDPTGRRPHSVYFFVVSFVTLTVAIFGSVLVVGAVLLLTANVTDSVSHALDRLLLFSVLTMLVGGLLLAVHLRRGLSNARAESHEASPSKRVGQTYVSVVAFVSVLLLLGATVLSLYLIFAIAPGTFGSFGGRSWATRILIESLYVGAVAAFVIWRHSSMLSPPLRAWGPSDSASRASASAAPTDEAPDSGRYGDEGP